MWRQDVDIAGATNAYPKQFEHLNYWQTHVYIYLVSTLYSAIKFVPVIYSLYINTKKILFYDHDYHKVLKYTSKVSIVHGIWYNKFKSLQ